MGGITLYVAHYVRWNDFIWCAVHLIVVVEELADRDILSVIVLFNFRVMLEGVVRGSRHHFSLHNERSPRAVRQMKHWRRLLDGRILAAVRVEELFGQDPFEGRVSAGEIVEEVVGMAPD